MELLVNDALLWELVI
jgi:hypothetical protein